ncbi:MAG: hypothetical protein CM15mP60_3430 [Alphaproteobacteria bacterium]|nr:MAG: hypothetical protein CM15mP60_3430 [Alphaproteobacteria bacterium]
MMNAFGCWETLFRAQDGLVKGQGLENITLGENPTINLTHGV